MKTIKNRLRKLEQLAIAVKEQGPSPAEILLARERRNGIAPIALSSESIKEYRTLAEILMGHFPAPQPRATAK